MGSIRLDFFKHCIHVHLHIGLDSREALGVVHDASPWTVTDISRSNHGERLARDLHTDYK